MEATAQQKVELRRRMREKLAVLMPAGVHAVSAVIAGRLRQIPEFHNCRRVCVYVSKGNEVDTHRLIREWLAAGKRVSVPAFRDGGYVAAELKAFSELAPGQFGILEPKTVRMAEKLEMLLMPGLAFDAEGYRLGRGMGFFDRIMAGSDAVKIGLAYDFQIVQQVPAERHDERLNFIVTETNLITIKGKST